MSSYDVDDKELEEIRMKKLLSYRDVCSRRKGGSNKRL